MKHIYKDDKTGSILAATNSKAESDQFIKENAGAEKLYTVGPHKVTGKFRILAYKGDEWITLGPEFDTLSEANLSLRAVSLQAIDLGMTSLIKGCQQLDANTIKHHGKPMSDIPDSEWIGMLPPEELKEIDPPELFTQSPSRINFN